MKFLYVMIAVFALASCGIVGGDCCKHCKDSQACGDSCIPNGSNCTKSGGCACDG